jgi:hypothetical protein
MAYENEASISRQWVKQVSSAHPIPYIYNEPVLNGG